MWYSEKRSSLLQYGIIFSGKNAKVCELTNASEIFIYSVSLLNDILIYFSFTMALSCNTAMFIITIKSLIVKAPWDIFTELKLFLSYRCHSIKSTWHFVNNLEI